jgi:phosphoribosylpyrophosphate synthetase
VTGSSIINAVRWLHNNGVEETHVAISHLKIREEFVPALLDAHHHFGLKVLHATDTIPQLPSILNLPFIRIHSLARRFASTINRMHYNQSISTLFKTDKV